MRRHLRDMLVLLSGGALLLSVAVDALAMVGRQIQIPLIGSIEIVEAAVLIAGCGALIIATLDGAHARVKLVIERLPSRGRAGCGILHALAAMLFFAALFAGSVWIAIDLWSGHEESELLRIPYRPLRIATAISLAVLVLLAIRSLWVRGSK